MRQDREVLGQHLREQLDFLRTSGALFDGGMRAEAKRLATAIRILVHDTRSSHSLLGQLGVKDQIRYLDTGHGPPPMVGLRLDAGLATVRMIAGPTARTDYAAPLGEFGGPGSDRVRAPQRFQDWWTRTVLTDRQGNQFSREGLALGLANLDGGAHVDPELQAAYAALSRSNSLGWTSFDGGGHMLLAESPVLANVRQIAWELEQTIAAELGDLVGEPPSRPDAGR